MTCFLAVLILQVEVIRGQLSQNLAWEGRSAVAEPAYKVGKLTNARGSVLPHFENPKREFQSTTRSRVFLTGLEVYEIVVEYQLDCFLGLETKIKEKAESV